MLAPALETPIPSDVACPQAMPFDPKSLKRGAWAGKRCFIVGGGPSLKGFDWSLLEGERVIALNRAIEFVNPSIAFAMDRGFTQKLIAGMLGEAAIEKWVNHPCRIMYSLKHGNQVLLNEHGHEEFMDSKFKACNSGLSALLLALYLGCSEVCLLGFDMHDMAPSEKQHFYENGQQHKKPKEQYARFRKVFSRFASDYNGSAKIVNLNRDSALRCFEFGDFPEHDECPLELSLEEKSWSGRRCFIVGGGPSLEGFDWSLLEGELTVGCNNVFRFFEPTIAMVSSQFLALDIMFGKHGEEAKEKWIDHPCKIWTTQERKRVALRPGWDKAKEFYSFRSNNSGLIALKLAVYLGAKEIFLLGYDMHNGEKFTHFYDDGEPAPLKEAHYARFLNAFDEFAPVAKRLSQIVNLTPNSRLECFESGLLSEVL